MSFKKEILAFYALIIASTGIIIAAENPACEPMLQPKTSPAEEPVKCCKLKNQQSIPQSTPSLYFTEGILRFRA